MLQRACTGCRQVLAHEASDCGYCRTSGSGSQVAGRPMRDVWCTSHQRFVQVAWIEVGQAFVCVCAKAHEVLECGACGKAWGTAVNSFSDTDRRGLRRCSGCRTPPQEAVPVPTACSVCGPERPPDRRRGGLIGRLRNRRRNQLRCAECQAPVGWWTRHGEQQGEQPPEVIVAIPVAAAGEGTAEWSNASDRWRNHGDHHEFVPGDPGAPGKPSAA